MPDIKLTPQEVERIIPHILDVQYVDRCGQKVVFSGIIDEKKYAIKFLKPTQTTRMGDESILLDDVTARARREIDTMQQCQSPYLVKMGPIGLTVCEVGDEEYIYYTEEFINGDNLKDYLAKVEKMDPKEIVELAFHISEAISAIWQFSKIHRDIKPGNIMRKSDTEEFVLLDMGLVFDLQDESFSIAPVGTPLYFSPEQMDFTNRRTIMNFRSDLFSLGIVLYEMATGKHPFVTSETRSTWDVFGNIRDLNPTAPKQLVPDLPQSLSDVILRLLAKRPALRYRSIKIFQQALDTIREEL